MHGPPGEVGLLEIITDGKRRAGGGGPRNGGGSVAGRGGSDGRDSGRRGERGEDDGLGVGTFREVSGGVQGGDDVVIGRPLLRGGIEIACAGYIGGEDGVRAAVGGGNFDIVTGRTVDAVPGEVDLVGAGGGGDAGGGDIRPAGVFDEISGGSAGVETEVVDPAVQAADAAVGAVADLDSAAGSAAQSEGGGGQTRAGTEAAGGGGAGDERGGAGVGALINGEVIGAVVGDGVIEPLIGGDEGDVGRGVDLERVQGEGDAVITLVEEADAVGGAFVGGAARAEGKDARAEDIVAAGGGHVGNGLEPDDGGEVADGAEIQRGVDAVRERAGAGLGAFIRAAGEIRRQGKIQRAAKAGNAGTDGAVEVGGGVGGVGHGQAKRPRRRWRHRSGVVVQLPGALVQPGKRTLRVWARAVAGDRKQPAARARSERITGSLRVTVGRFLFAIGFIILRAICAPFALLRSA